MQRRDLDAAAEALRRLPPPRAPETLLPRVVAAVQAWACRPWYARAWFTWPVPIQAGSAAALVLIAAGAVALWPSARAVIMAWGAGLASEAMWLLEPLVIGVQAGAVVCRVMWHALLEPVVAYVALVAVVMGLACAAGVTAISRLTAGAR